MLKIIRQLVVISSICFLNTSVAAQSKTILNFLITGARISYNEFRTSKRITDEDLKNRLVVYDSEKNTWSLYLTKRRNFSITKISDTSDDTKTKIIYQCINELNEHCIITWSRTKYLSDMMLLVFEGSAIKAYDLEVLL